MRGIHLLLFVVTLPVVAALGHDIYLFYINEGLEGVPDLLQGETPNDKGFLSLFASLGFVWTRYHPESYKMAVQSLDKDTWAIINMILAQKAFFVGLAFAGIFYIIALILKVIGLGGGNDGWNTVSKQDKGDGEDLRVLSRDKEKQYKYKRK